MEEIKYSVLILIHYAVYTSFDRRVHGFYLAGHEESWIGVRAAKQITAAVIEYGGGS